jgi:predicted acyltransferase
MSPENANLGSHDEAACNDRTPKKQRLLSLDVFRGLTIASMVLVNNHGSSGHFYPGLHHVAWEGWSLAEVICGWTS